MKAQRVTRGANREASKPPLCPSPHQPERIRSRCQYRGGRQNNLDTGDFLPLFSPTDQTWNFLRNQPPTTNPAALANHQPPTNQPANQPTTNHRPTGQPANQPPTANRPTGQASCARPACGKKNLAFRGAPPLSAAGQPYIYAIEIRQIKLENCMPPGGMIYFRLKHI